MALIYLTVPNCLKRFFKRRYTINVKPFDFNKNKDRIETAVNKNIALAGLEDPKGFSLVEGFVAPTIHQVLSDDMKVAGKALSVVAVVANSSGLIYYFHLDILLPGENLE